MERVFQRELGWERRDLEGVNWSCPHCSRPFHRRFLVPEEVRQLYGYSRDLKIEVEGPDSRVDHLRTHLARLNSSGTPPAPASRSCQPGLPQSFAGIYPSESEIR